MLEITLLKTLFHEMDEDKIKEVRVFDDENASKYHELDMEVPGFPEFKTLTSNVTYMAYGSAMYYVHMNGDLENNADIHSPVMKAAIYHFFKTYRPEFLKQDLPEDISELSILDCFDIASIPDYRPKYAFPGIVMLEDMKNGTYKGADKDKPTFPGLRMLMGGSAEERDESKPAFFTKNQEVTEFKDKDDFAQTMEELKKQFSIELMVEQAEQKEED